MRSIAIAGNIQANLDIAFGRNPYFFGIMMKELMLNNSDVYNLYLEKIRDIERKDIVNMDKYSAIRMHVPELNPNESFETNLEYLRDHYEKQTLKECLNFFEKENKIDLNELFYGNKERVKIFSDLLAKSLETYWFEKYMLKNQKFGQLDVTRREVKEFFETYQDSLGMISEKFEIAHIFVNPKSTDKLKLKSKLFAQSLLDSIKNGADFAELAKKVSEDPGSASAGGDLGFVKRGVFYPEFESAAFKLKEGELSEVIESPVGFHIIELIEKRGESIRTRHILVKPKSDDEADLNAIEKLSDIRDSINNNLNTFEYFASKYSDDKETANFGGLLGKFEVGQLDKSLLDQVYKLSEGEISFPKRLEVGNGEYGFHIVKLIKRVPAHKADLDLDYEEIKRIALFKKREKLISNWISEIKENIYWELRI